MPPDVVELSVNRDVDTLAVIISLAPVYTDKGLGCQLNFHWQLITNLVVPMKMNVTDYDKAARIGNELFQLIDRNLRKSGARKIAPHQLFRMPEQTFSCKNLTYILNEVAALVTLHQELNYYAGSALLGWYKVILHWYGTISWFSKPTGTIAATVYYGAPGTQFKILFFRWCFSAGLRPHSVNVSYEFSTTDLCLANTDVPEWELVGELVRQTASLFAPPKKVPEAALGATDEKAVVSRSLYWPSLQDYTEAMQNLSENVNDPELRVGKLHLQNFGLPYVISGAFACVFKVQCSDGPYAVRCFARPVRDHSERYRKMSRFICSDRLPYTLDFHFIEKGIRLKGEWFPLVKMKWVEGESVTGFINKNLYNRTALAWLRSRFLLMTLELARDGVAHGDLQHGNMIIHQDELILVDYDGMFFPGLEGYKSREKGHPNYQHPARSDTHFGPYLDNFSAWLIDTALFAIAEDPSLWKKFGEGDESMLFRRSDLLTPSNSPLFHALQTHSNREFNRRAEYLRYLISAPVEKIPHLYPGYPDLVSPGLVYEYNSASNIPEWMK